MSEKRYTYTLLGHGDFAFDMLRYDSCWPADPASASNLSVTRADSTYMSPREVTITGIRPPTTGRWQSFGWHPATTMRVSNSTREWTEQVPR
jgi:hypothetical protein